MSSQDVNEDEMKSPQLLKVSSENPTVLEVEVQVQTDSEICSLSSQVENEDPTPEDQLAHGATVEIVSDGTPVAIPSPSAKVPSSPAPVLPSKVKVTILKKYFEDKAAELQAQQAASYKPSSTGQPEAGKRRIRAPEMLSMYEKKYLFEQRIRKNEEDIVDAKNATRGASMKF